MRRYAVVLRQAAQNDLRDIFERVLEISGNRETARRFTLRILQRCRRIGNVAYGGRPRDDLFSGLRTVPFEHSAVIAYLVTDKVEIVNVFYGGRDYEALYEAGPSED